MKLKTEVSKKIFRENRNQDSDIAVHISHLKCFQKTYYSHCFQNCFGVGLLFSLNMRVSYQAAM